MSHTQQETQDVEENRVDKTITIVGYVPEKYGDVREFADAHTDRAMFEMEENVVGDFELRFPDGSSVAITEDQARHLRTKGIGDLKIEDCRTVLEEPKYRDYLPFRELPKTHFSDTLAWFDFWEEVEYKDWARRVSGKHSDFKIKCRIRSDEIPLLKAVEDIEPDDLYVEDSDPSQVVKFRIMIRNCPASEIEDVEAAFATGFFEDLAKRGPFERVRLAGCEKKTVEKWTCINV